MRHFTFMNVVGHAVRKQIVTQNFRIILGRWLGAGTRVARNTKNGRSSILVKERKERTQ